MNLKHFLLLVTLAACCVLLKTQSAHAQAGTLWGSDFSGDVFRIDPSTGSRELVFEFEFQGPVPRTISGLGYDRVTRRIVGATGGNLFGDPVVLFSFDPFAASPVPKILGEYEPAFASTSRVSGVAFDSVGNLFLNEDNGTNEQLVQYDLDSMAIVNVFDLPSPANFNIGGLATGRNPGEIQAIHASSEVVLSLDVPNGPVDSFGSFSQVGFTNAIAYDPGNDRYFLSDTRLVEFDPTTGQAISVVSSDSYHGLTFVSVPEPAASIPLVYLFTVMIARRRRY